MNGGKNNYINKYCTANNNGNICPLPGVSSASCQNSVCVAKVRNS
jgi:hypothetical protein